MNDYAAPLHSCKYRWLHAPATNLDPGTSSPDPLHALSHNLPPVKARRHVVLRSRGSLRCARAR